MCQVSACNNWNHFEDFSRAQWRWATPGHHTGKILPHLKASFARVRWENTYKYRNSSNVSYLLLLVYRRMHWSLTTMVDSGQFTPTFFAFASPCSGTLRKYGLLCWAEQVQARWNFSLASPMGVTGQSLLKLIRWAFILPSLGLLPPYVRTRIPYWDLSCKVIFWQGCQSIAPGSWQFSWPGSFHGLLRLDRVGEIASKKLRPCNHFFTRVLVQSRPYSIFSSIQEEERVTSKWWCLSFD